MARLHDAAGHPGRMADQEARQCGTGSCNRGLTQNGAATHHDQWIHLQGASFASGTRHRSAVTTDVVPGASATTTAEPRASALRDFAFFFAAVFSSTPAKQLRTVDEYPHISAQSGKMQCEKWVKQLKLPQGLPAASGRRINEKDLDKRQGWEMDQRVKHLQQEHVEESGYLEECLRLMSTTGTTSRAQDRC